MELKDLLKNERISKGLTQEDFAKVLSITRGTLSHLEIGRIPSADTAKKLSTYFNKPINELLGNRIINKLANLDTTNLVINNLIEENEINENFISDEAKKLIWTSLELEIKLKLKLRG